MATETLRPDGDEAREERFLPTRRSLLERLGNLEDQVSWQDFFDTYWRLIYRTALKAGLSEAEAEDVVQETVITISKRIREFKYDPALGSFKNWLLQTTRWRICDHRRRSQRGPVLSPLPDPQGESMLDWLAGPAPNDLDAIWEHEWTRNLLDAAVDRVKKEINPKHFQVFELCSMKGWPAAKAASLLGLNRAQVYVIKHRVGRLIKSEICRLEKLAS